LETFIPAIPIVAEDTKKVRFLLVGDGPEMSKIQKKILQFKNKEVLLTGRVSYKEAVRYINAFDVGVAPFIRERNESIGLSPLKIYDYAACSVPIVLSRIKGLEILEKKNFGVLVELDDPVAMANSIISLLKNSKLRRKLGKNGRKIAEKEFSWQRVAEQILNKIKD